MINSKQEGQCCRGVSPVAAGLTGLVIGVGVTVAGALVLKSEKNRKKMMRMITDLKEKLTGVGKEVKKEIEEDKEVVGERIEVGKKKVKRIVKIIKKAPKKGAEK